MAQAIADAERFERDFKVAEDGPDVFDRLLGLLARVPVAGKQVHDANPGESGLSPMVATMLAHGITLLLTFNVAQRRAPDEADFRRFGSTIALEPLDAA